MNKVLSWVKTPTTMTAVGLVLAAGVYWFTGSPDLALLAAAAVLGSVSDHTKDILAKIEALETAAKSVAPVTMAAATAKVEAEKK